MRCATFIPLLPLLAGRSETISTCPSLRHNSCQRQAGPGIYNSLKTQPLRVARGQSPYSGRLTGAAYDPPRELKYTTEEEADLFPEVLMRKPAVWRAGWGRQDSAKKLLLGGAGLPARL